MIIHDAVSAEGLHNRVTEVNRRLVRNDHEHDAMSRDINELADRIAVLEYWQRDIILAIHQPKPVEQKRRWFRRSR